MKKYLFEQGDSVMFLLGAFGGFFINLLTAKIQWSATISTSGIIIVFVLFFIYRKWITQLNSFEFYVTYGRWKRETFNHVTTWTCDESDEYQIVLENEAQDFNEVWLRGRFPDGHTQKDILTVKRRGIAVMQLQWLSSDGGRYFYPMPKIRTLNSGEIEYFWEKNSLQHKLANKIGEYYRESSLEELARRLQLQIK